jgi:putative transposase
MARHTTFRYCLDPTVEQQAVLARHAGAARFAFNQCLRLHLQARRFGRRDGSVVVPWTGFDFINVFNAWKKTESAGRLIAVSTAGEAEVVSSGLVWRGEVCQQVFEEAAVDLGKALKVWTDSRRGKRAGKRVGHPRFKKKNQAVSSFRLRNKHPKNGRPAIRVGDTHPRSVTLPGIGCIRVRDDTRRLRRLLTKSRGRVLFATVSCRAGRWWVSLNVEAADLHPAGQHPARPGADASGWVGVDRGLCALLVAGTAAGREVARVTDPPKALARRMRRQRRLARAVTRKPKGSKNRRQAAARLGRHHHRTANIRRHFLHQVTGELVKTHDRLVIENLNVRGMLTNHRLARAISDAAWSEFARQVSYKQAWRGGQVMVADRWFASSKTCSGCGNSRQTLKPSERTYRCSACGLVIDRDLNAAVNLAAWAENHAQVRDPQAGGPVTNAHRQERSGRHLDAGETDLDDVGTQPDRTSGLTKGRPRRAVPNTPSPRLFDTL